MARSGPLASHRGALRVHADLAASGVGVLGLAHRAKARLLGASRLFTVAACGSREQILRQLVKGLREAGWTVEPVVL